MFAKHCQICFCNKFYYFHKVQNHLWIGSRNQRVSNTYCSSLLLTLMVAWHNLQELQQFLNFTYWILSFGNALAKSDTTTILENKLLRILGQVLYMCSQISTPIWQAQFEVIRNTFVALDRVDTICGSITAYTLHKIEYSRAWSMPSRWQNTLTYIPYHQYEKDIFTVVPYRTIPPNFQDCWFDKASWGSASFPANGGSDSIVTVSLVACSLSEQTDKCFVNCHCCVTRPQNSTFLSTAISSIHQHSWPMCPYPNMLTRGSTMMKQVD